MEKVDNNPENDNLREILAQLIAKLQQTDEALDEFKTQAYESGRHDQRVQDMAEIDDLHGQIALLRAEVDDIPNKVERAVGEAVVALKASLKQAYEHQQGLEDASEADFKNLLS